MKPHGLTGKRNAAKAPEKVRSVTRQIRFTPAEIADQDAQRGKMPWSKWARLHLSVSR